MPPLLEHIRHGGAGGEPALLFEEGWVWKKGRGRSDLGHFKIGRRNWAKRYLVLVRSRDGVEPSAEPKAFTPRTGRVL